MTFARACARLLCVLLAVAGALPIVGCASGSQARARAQRFLPTLRARVRVERSAAVAPARRLDISRAFDLTLQWPTGDTVHAPAATRARPSPRRQGAAVWPASFADYDARGSAACHIARLCALERRARLAAWHALSSLARHAHGGGR